MFQRWWSGFLSLFLGLKCDRCGRRGASLTIEAERTHREEQDGGRVRVSEYRVRSAAALCPKCRRDRRG
jgi:hypothetical protein